MSLARFRLRSLMILVLISALGMALFVQLSKVNLDTINDLKPRLLILGSFFLLVVAKLGLLIGTRTARYQREIARNDGPVSDRGDGTSAS